MALLSPAPRVSPLDGSGSMLTACTKTSSHKYVGGAQSTLGARFSLSSAAQLNLGSLPLIRPCRTFVVVVGRSVNPGCFTSERDSDARFPPGTFRGFCGSHCSLGSLWNVRGQGIYREMPHVISGCDGTTVTAGVHRA